jgi:hypothetical protein
MVATSATGVGKGSADKKNKGSEHLTISANKIIGPRVVFAKQVTLDGSGDLVVNLPLLSGSASDYIVLATDAGAAAAAAVAAALTFSGGTVLTLKGPASSAVNVLVIKAGLAV